MKQYSMKDGAVHVENENDIIGKIIATAITTITEVSLEGRAKKKTSLRDMTQDDHIDRAITHLVDFLDGNQCEPRDLEHALWRISVAIFRKNENRDKTI